MMPMDRALLIKQVIELMGLLGVVGITCGSGVLIMWLRTRARRAAAPDLSRQLDEIVARIERLDGAVEAVAVEVERISEGQRFTTRLLAERPAVPAIAERARQIGSTTPH
ncbi:MAG TPA: hypothetical protein VN651_14180 [Gemmatimonadaceae bacterium]|nr:hypothetical protein [Gemmatimonadaceae bacterium]